MLRKYDCHVQERDRTVIFKFNGQFNISVSVIAPPTPRRVLVQRPKPEEAPYASPGVYIQGQRILVEKVRYACVSNGRSILDLTKLGTQGGLG